MHGSRVRGGKGPGGGEEWKCSQADVVSEVCEQGIELASSCATAAAAAAAATTTAAAARMMRCTIDYHHALDWLAIRLAIQSYS